MKKADPKFESLTRYLPLLKNDHIGKWVIDHENDGSSEHPICLPYVEYSETVQQFLADFHLFNKANKDFALCYATEILEQNDIYLNGFSLTKADFSRLDARCIVALMINVFRAERFSDGSILHGFESGRVFNCLERLKEIDEGE